MKIFYSAVKKMTVTLSLILGLLGSLGFLCVSNAYGATDVPSKQIIIINNTPNPIYPVIETSMTGTDEWLQATFGATSSSDAYAHSHLYRVYVNPGSAANSSGIPAGGSVTVNVPFYSALVSSPTPPHADQYIDWWNGMRVYVYDNYDAFNSHYLGEGTPVTPVTSGLTCGSTGCGSLAIYANTVGLPENDPLQLTEYTFGDIDKHVPIRMPYDFSSVNVDYDISYVDHVYLPVAMEPVNNPVIGYTGTVKDITTFRTAVTNFVNTGWATYISPYLGSSNPKVPGTYNMLVGSPNITPDTTAEATIRANWINCKTNDANCQKVNTFFTQNLANYTTLCPNSPHINPGDATFLDHIYGFVPFNDAINCPGQMNALVDTPGGDFTGMETAYKTLQYYSSPPNSFVFNPYVDFIHGSNYLDMKGSYAFSIDDIVGNMHEAGNGIYIAVGGSNGLPNPNVFDPTKLVHVNLQLANGGPSVQWMSYTTCISSTPDNIPSGSLSYTVDTSQITSYPCNMSVTDYNGKTYNFQLLRGAPFASNPVNSDYINGDPSDSWWQAINVSANGTGAAEKSYLNMPPPNSVAIVAPVLRSAVRDTTTPANINLTFTQAYGGSGNFTYTYSVNGSNWTNFSGSGTQITLLGVGSGSANIMVVAKDEGYNVTSDSNVINVPAMSNPVIAPLITSAFPRKSEPQTVALNYTPATGGSGSFTYTANVNGSRWSSQQFPCSSTYPQLCGNVYVVSPTQIYLKSALISGRSISVSLTAQDTSGGSPVTSNSFNVNPLQLKH